MSTPTLLEAAKALLEDCKETLRDGGGCDHSVGICWCANIKRIEQAESAIAAEEAKKPEAWAMQAAEEIYNPNERVGLLEHTRRMNEIAAIIARHAPPSLEREAIEALRAVHQCGLRWDTKRHGAALQKLLAVLDAQQKQGGK